MRIKCIISQRRGFLSIASCCWPLGCRPFTQLANLGHSAVSNARSAMWTDGERENRTTTITHYLTHKLHTGYEWVRVSMWWIYHSRDHSEWLNSMGNSQYIGAFRAWIPSWFALSDLIGIWLLFGSLSTSAIGAQEIIKPCMMYQREIWLRHCYKLLLHWRNYYIKPRARDKWNNIYL